MSADRQRKPAGPRRRRARGARAGEAADGRRRDTIPRMTKQIVRRELEELERQGAARRVGRIRCNVRLKLF